MKAANSSVADRGVLGLLTHLAESLMPSQRASTRPDAGDPAHGSPDAAEPVAALTSATTDAPGPAAQWWQDHPAPGTQMFWIDDSAKDR